MIQEKVRITTGYHFGDCRVHESGLYYLQSRYYDPAVGRFISADGYLSTGQGFVGFNMFAYCGNNPVVYCDPTGYFISELINSTLVFIKQKIKEYSIIKYDVPLYIQESYNLCWDFCQIMVEHYYEGRSCDNDVAIGQAVELACEQGECIDGEFVWDKGAWPTNLGNRIEPGGIFTLYLALLDGPVYGYYWRGKHSKDDNKYPAHLIVVTGVNLLRGTVYTNNPWGLRGEQTYSEFTAMVYGAYGSYKTNMPLYAIYDIE